MRPIDPSLAPDQRLVEVARILGVGILRLRGRAALPAADPGSQQPQKSASPSLDVSAETGLSMHGS